MKVEGGGHYLRAVNDGAHTVVYISNHADHPYILYQRYLKPVVLLLR